MHGSDPPVIQAMRSRYLHQSHLPLKVTAVPPAANALSISWRGFRHEGNGQEHADLQHHGSGSPGTASA